jgi:hypothetical protein
VSQTLIRDEIGINQSFTYMEITMYTPIVSMKQLVVAIALGMSAVHAVGAEKTEICRSKVEVLANSSDLSFFERQAVTNLVRRNNRAGVLAHCANAVRISATRK